ncbi:MAG TPA: hypothetical protein VGL72_12045 [Bryobacteraceae bacterium]|jgi:hypothetical protein
MKAEIRMGILPSLKSEVIYARDMVKAGLDAAASGEKAVTNLAPAVLGVAVGVLGVYLGRKGRMGNRALLGGLIGGALGFSSGVVWGTREQARVGCINAAQSVQAVRDARWLEKNPVAYA